MEQTFSDQTFEKKDLAGGPLQKGEYENCIFKHADLSGGDFSDMVFIDCTFIGCNLSLVKLTKTVLRDVVFKDCKMLGLHFENCHEFGLSLRFEGCVLNQSSFYRTKQKKTSFKNVQLHEVDLTECDLTDAVFEGCDFTGATFDHTVLEKADLRTSFNYTIDPEKNRIKKAQFSIAGIRGLLEKYDIKIFPTVMFICILLLLTWRSNAQKPGEPVPGLFYGRILPSPLEQ